MAQQITNVGSAPNDGTGDTLRNSQIKANANFTELYNAVDSKLDKVTTTDVEKVYIKNADGSQGMKPVSEFGGGGSVQSVTGDSVDNTDPLNPIINAIPLSGTTVGNPVSGNIEIVGAGADLRIFSMGDSDILQNNIVFGDGVFAFGVKNLIDGGGSFIQVYENYIEVIAQNDSVGIKGSEDFTSNITDLDYVQKKYVDTKVPKVTTSGVERAYIINADGSQGTKATSDFGGGTPSLQAVTDIGSTTTNYITIESASYNSLITSGGINLHNTTTLDNISISPIEISLRDDVYSSDILARTRTQNTVFYFEDEGGEKSIATREWVNANLDNYLVNITTPSPNHTGTSAETNITSYNFVIPANTILDGDTLRIENLLWGKIGVLNASTCRVRLSNTNNFATASQVAVFSASAANVYMRGCRTFNINSGLLRGVSFTANGIFNDFTLTNLGFSTLALDFTQPIYGFISLQVTNSADIVLMRELKIKKIKKI